MRPIERLRRSGPIAVAVAALLLAGLSPSAASAAPIPCRSQAVRAIGSPTMDIVQVRTFTVEVKTAKVYRIGGRAAVDAVVTRPAHRDPLQVGPEFEPPTSAPAADVNVGIGIHVGDVFVPGFGVTDQNGKVRVTIKLPSYMRPGTASIDAYAWKIQADSPCLTLEEDGFTHVDKAFVVTR